ncbi:MAG: hypothetical protein ACJ754_04095 [Pyrinomonadaceae bacterium]
MKADAFAEAVLCAHDHRPVRRRALRWPRLLARFNYRESRTRRKGGNP